MDTDQQALRDRATQLVRQFIDLYNQAVNTGRLEEACDYITRLAKSTGLKHDNLNDVLFTTLAQLKKYDVALYYARVAAADALEQGNINRILHNYQTLLFFRKKLVNPPADDLSTRMKEHLFRRAPRLKAKHNLVPKHDPRQHHKIRIGHVIGLVVPGHAPSKMVFQELKYIDHDAFDTYIFTTEWAAHWLFSGQDDEGVQSYYTKLNNTIQTTYKTQLFIGPVKQNFLQRCLAVCKKIIECEIDVLIINATDAEAITMMLAMIKPAPVMVNAVHGGPMPLANLDGYIQLQRDDFLKDTTIPQHFLSITSDVQNDPSEASDAQGTRVLKKIAELRKNYVVTGTFGSLFKVQNDQYLSTLARILKEHANAYHVFIGMGDFTDVQARLRALGVADKVYYGGFQTNIKPFMEAIDIYLASFPYPGHTCELELMALGKPVVSMAWTEGHHYNSGARVVGLAECIAPQNDCNRYCEVAHTFIINQTLRQDIGKRLRKRFDEEFAPVVRVRKVEELYRDLIQKYQAGM